MNAKKKYKVSPAGRNDKFEITYTGFAADIERTEIKVDEGHEFDNEGLLQMLGFEKDENGNLKLPASDYEAEIADNGEIIRRKKGSKVLTENENITEQVR